MFINVEGFVEENVESDAITDLLQFVVKPIIFASRDVDIE